MTSIQKYNLFFILLLSVVASSLNAIAADKKNFPIDTTQSCTASSCHQEVGKKANVHLVAAEGTTCMVCHATITQGQHAFKLTAEGGALCTQCHGSKVEKKYQHFPVKVGLCTFCHDPHQSDYPKQLKFPPTAELCQNCHPATNFSGNTVHGPVEQGQCLECHDPHASDHPKQIKAAVPDLCFGCHDKSQKDAAGVRLPAIKPLFANEESNHHKPFGDGKCLDCHYHHAGENHRLLKSAYPSSFYTSFSKEKYICFNCHDEKAFAEPRTLDATDFRNGNLNLHYRHVNRKKGRTCRACHHHHSSDRPKLIRKAVRFGTRAINIKEYEKTETGGKCAPLCHSMVQYDRYNPVQNSLKVTLRKGVDATPEELQNAKARQTVPDKAKQ